MLSSNSLIEAFNECFLVDFNTRLVGGADEPLYLPARGSIPATVFFRFDYISSALHEISHWCIAGNKRRELEDYGYWYESESRDINAQTEFERVEVAPQALECILHWVVGVPFKVSVDNLSLPDYDSSHFEQKVIDRVYVLISKGLPERAAIFAHYMLEQQKNNLVLSEFLKQKYENHCR